MPALQPQTGRSHGSQRMSGFRQTDHCRGDRGENQALVENGHFDRTADVRAVRGEGPILRHFNGRGSHLRPDATRVLAKTTSFRITAVMATFAGLPVSTSRL